MDVLQRLKYLSSQMSLEFDQDAYSYPRASGPYLDRTESCPDAIFVHPAQLPNGKRIKLLKTLLSSSCERNCYYCPFRAGREFRRATFQPEEFARLFYSLHHKGIADGIFLSSGVIGGSIQTQDKLIETAEILRSKLGFTGYIHLKIMPGSEKGQVVRAMELSDRVSVNLEAPNTERLRNLAPQKQFFDELIQPFRWIQEIRLLKSPTNTQMKRWPSSVTQFVAGGAGESDLELLSTTDRLFRDLNLKRVYYSAFNPILNTPMESHPPTAPIREHRLYQASFLIRDYDFEFEEIPFEKGGMLRNDIDPKLAWARLNILDQPIEVNTADRRTLMRVPGIGPKMADAILVERKQQRIADISTLYGLGINIKRAVDFLLINGKKPPNQIQLF